MQEPTKYDSVFWIETEKIHPNPYQPRREFDSARLNALAESIRQYGVLQPLVVTRFEHTKPDGGIASEYELIAGERRLRASKLVGLREVPAVIRGGKEDRRVKLELAIIENLQREDLNAIDRARALAQLSDEFGISHSEIGAKVGRSREYVSNSIRLLRLPEEIQQAVVGKEISEGHARALLMVSHKPKEMDTLFRDIMTRKTSVRVAEQLARRIATDKIRKKTKTPEMLELEKSLTETLGTRVVIENRPNNTGRLLIEFFSPDDLVHIADVFSKRQAELFATENEVSLNKNKDEDVEQIKQAFSENELQDTQNINNTDISADIDSGVASSENKYTKEIKDVPKEEISETSTVIIVSEQNTSTNTPDSESLKNSEENTNKAMETPQTEQGIDTVSSKSETKQNPTQGNPEQEDDLYSIRNFTV